MDSENPMPGGSAQSTDQLDLLAHFQSQTQDLDVKAGKYEGDSSFPDEVQIQIEDLETKLSALEAQLVEKHTTNGGITADESREMKDLIRKHSAKLNSIDFMGRTDALTGRRIELLDIILKIQKKLEGPTKMETQSLSGSRLVVEVTEGKLTINESASQNLLQLCSENNGSGKYGISLVSIVGDRKSGKSRLFESIQNHALGSEWKVLNQPGRTVECSGISCSVLCADEKEKRRLIFLMDIICNENIDSKIYTKLVDFCILTSDVVFYTEKEELDLVDPRNPCYWNVDSSVFATSSLPIRNTLNRPHLFVLTRDLEYLYLQETPLLEFRANCIRQQESENATSPSHSPQNQGSPLEAKKTKPAPSTSSTVAQKQNPRTTNGAKLYNENLRDCFQNTQFFQNVAGNDLDFGAVEDIGKLFEEVSKMIERESSSSTDRWPSSLHHSAEKDTTLVSMGEEDITLVGKKALEKYDNYMRCQTEQQIFTDSKIQEFHDHARLILTSETVLSRFHEDQREDYLRLVNTHLRERRHVFVIQNRTRIMETIKARKMLLEEGKMMYLELLSRYPAADSFNDFVRSARTFAWRLYEKRAKGKNLNVAAWKKAFLSEVDALNQEIFLDNRSKETSQMKISLEDFSKEFRKLELCLRAEGEASLSLVFHLTPSSIQAAVFIPDPDHNAQSESNSPVFTHYWPPHILFEAGDIGLIGSEAQIAHRSSSGSFFNVYSLLQRGTQGSYTVKMNEGEETLEVEEILATFLFQIKLQIEAELNWNLSSAVFAMCSHFSITARHMVKTSLSLAGFQNSVLVHSKVAASVGELVKPRNFGERHSSVLLLHDEQEITQLCIQGAAPSFKVDAFDNLTNTKKSVANIQRQVILNSLKLTYCPTAVIIMRMSPTSVLSEESPSPTQRLLTTALTNLKKRDPGFENCEILIKNVDECEILLGAHLYSNRVSDGMKELSKNKDKCTVFGEMKKGRGIRRFFGPLSVSGCKFTNDLDFFNRTKKCRKVLSVKMRGTDKLWIFDSGVAGCGARSVVRLTRLNQKDRKEMEIRIYYSKEGLLDFQLKSQNERVEDAVAFEADYLLPQQVEAANVKLSRYLKTNYEIKIEDSWKTFVKNTDSMSRRDEGSGERSDLENSHSLPVASQIKTDRCQLTIELAQVGMHHQTHRTSKEENVGD